MDKLKAYHSYATERAIKTVAQTLIAFITASSALSIVDLDFTQALGVAALAGVMSLLTSVLTYDKESNKEG
jgi:hypothetical protein